MTFIAILSKTAAIQLCTLLPNKQNYPSKGCPAYFLGKDGPNRMIYLICFVSSEESDERINWCTCIPRCRKPWIGMVLFVAPKPILINCNLIADYSFLARYVRTLPKKAIFAQDMLKYWELQNQHLFVPG